MFKKLVLGVCLLLPNIQTLHAALLIEPYLGYSLGGGGETGVNTSTYIHEYSGLNLGVRFGYILPLGPMFGLDYSFATHDLDSTLGNASFSDEIKKKQWGLFVGFNLPVLVRVWGTYFFSAGFDGQDQEKNNQLYNENDAIKSGSGYALGIGYTGLPFLSINFEYRTFEYDTLLIEEAEATNYNGTDLNEFLLSVSTPINL